MIPIRFAAMPNAPPFIAGPYTPSKVCVKTAGSMKARRRRPTHGLSGCWAFFNHDAVRHATRRALPHPALRAYGAPLMWLCGAACIYQGGSLDLPEADVAFEDPQGPCGVEFRPEFKGRDGCRKPALLRMIATPGKMDVFLDGQSLLYRS
jgi:hypothetical protein